MSPFGMMFEATRRSAPYQEGPGIMRTWPSGLAFVTAYVVSNEEEKTLSVSLTDLALTSESSNEAMRVHFEEARLMSTVSGPVT